MKEYLHAELLLVGIILQPLESFYSEMTLEESRLGWDDISDVRSRVQIPLTGHDIPGQTLR